MESIVGHLFYISSSFRVNVTPYLRIFVAGCLVFYKNILTLASQTITLKIIMRINSNYKLREIAGETIVVNQGKAGTDMTRIISLNASAKLMYEQLSGRDFTMEDAAKVLVDAYGIDGAQALKDAAVWVEALQQCKVIG